MKTFYVMQGGALEEYLRESQSNGNSNNGYGEDKTDHPGCIGICNSNAHPDRKEECGCEELASSIDTFIIIGLLIGFILIVKKFR